MSGPLPVVYLARHGETAWTISRQHTGLTDVPLTARGEAEAVRLGERLEGLTFAAVLTSPLRRAVRTCDLAGFGSVAEREPDLVEWNYGAYEGRTSADIHAERPDWELFRDGCPGGESPQQIGARVDRVVGRVRAIDGNVLLFSSGHVLRVFAARWLGLAPAAGRHFLLGTASLSALGYEHNRAEPVIRLWNEGPAPDMRGDAMDKIQEQLQKLKTHRGFIAALDQSGGSTPGALRAYGIGADAWSSEAEMFAIAHRMRTRIITSPAFTGERILAAILFEDTIDREVEGRPTADYLWEVKRIVPFLKVDKGLAAEQHGVQLMKPMPELAALLDKARAKHIAGTKMRSLIKQADGAGIEAVVAQQFEIARQIIAAGLLPIVEPEVDIHCPDKARAEARLETAIRAALDGLPEGQQVMLKLTLPEQDDLYAEFVKHPRVVRVVALSGGYTRDEGNRRLRRNHGVVASFSRALVEGLSARQSPAEFDALLDASIQSIFEASNT